MKLEEKQEIAATARKLIRLLMSCDDDDFVDLVVCCVQDADTTPIEPEYL